MTNKRMTTLDCLRSQNEVHKWHPSKCNQKCRTVCLPFDDLDLKKKWIRLGSRIRPTNAIKRIVEKTDTLYIFSIYSLNFIIIVFCVCLCVCVLSSYFFIVIVLYFGFNSVNKDYLILFGSSVQQFDLSPFSRKLEGCTFTYLYTYNAELANQWTLTLHLK